MKLSSGETRALVADTKGGKIQLVDLNQQPPEVVFNYTMSSPGHLAVQGRIEDDDSDSDDED
ncbi:MAG TPA: hypothetical protein VFH51_03660 [Myxococcota bacterium]|nr:hypothetical protein [Myxococcota bacterium]